jgi:DNA polymerase I-like protein with 3'-5' exonuclease and polymerase domains
MEWLSGERNPPVWDFTLRPSYETAMQTLDALLRRAALAPIELSVDLETRGGHIACCGIAWSGTEAISIPFMCVEDPAGYFPLEHELALVLKLRTLFTHPSVSIIGQNFSYDAQYISRYWRFVPNLRHDTLVAQGLYFPGLPKALDFLASMYCQHYIYWKDDGKLWDPRTVNEDQLWSYNCEDACRTFEIAQVQKPLIEKAGFQPQHHFLLSLWLAVQKMMLTGVRIDEKGRAQMAMQLFDALAEREAWFASVLGHPLNPRSSKQMAALFYDDLRAPIQRNRKSGNATLDDKALDKIEAKVPLLLPLIKTIREVRSIGVFLSTFVQAPLDTDKRMRCSYNIVGTETFRFNSSENPFGSGTNLQNVPKGNERPKPGELGMPNIRKLFIPDPGCTIFDADLDRADLQVVVWEAEDVELKQMLREGVDIHSENAKALGVSRAMAKSWVHGCVTAGHECLTPAGWVAVEDYSDGTPIAVWREGQIFFEVPESFNRDLAVDLITFSGESWSQEMTWDHRVVYKDKAEYLVKRAYEIPKSARLPKGGYYSGPVYEPRAALIAAYQADGYIDSRGRLRFHFKKQRKVERLLALYPNAVVYHNADDTFTVWCPDHTLTLEMKTPGSWMLAWDGASLDIWLDEQEHWDGCKGKTGHVEVSSARPEVREWIATIAHLRGRAAAWYERTSGFGSPIYGTSINTRLYARVSSMQISRRSAAPTPVFCPQTSTGFWLFRREGKIGVTGNTNYGGGPRTMAANCGITVHQAERMQQRWFEVHPGIRAWHERTLNSLETTRSVRNRFGFRRFYFDRIEGLLPEALAWIPQSTVACVINMGLLNVSVNLPPVAILLQVHDSLVFQIETQRAAELLPQVRDQLKILIPYEDPLIIPVGLKQSTKSWGDVSDAKWESS